MTKFITENLSSDLKSRLLSYVNEVEMDYDPDESKNFREILDDYDGDLKGLN